MRYMAKEKILVVDDEEDLLELVSYNLNNFGYTVETVTSGEDALERMRVSAPDLVLLDLMLPGIDGLDVCRIAKNDPKTCLGCGKCAKACPINAIHMIPIENPQTKKKKDVIIDTSICLGCGVCALNCNDGVMSLVKRKKRVLHPETTFERVILQSLERGTLQNQLFDDPQSIGHKFMRGVIGGFLRLPPVKASLMSDTLRSSFLNFMKTGVEKQGKGWLLEM